MATPERNPFALTWPGVASDNPLLSQAVKNIERLDSRVDDLEHKVDTVLNMLATNNDDTKAIRDMVTTFRFLGTVAKWLVPIVSVVAGTIAAFKALAR